VPALREELNLNISLHIGGLSEKFPGSETVRRGMAVAPIGPSLFVRGDRFELVGSHGILFSEVMEKVDLRIIKMDTAPPSSKKKGKRRGRFSGKLKKRLQTLQDGMVMALLRPRRHHNDDAAGDSSSVGGGTCESKNSDDLILIVSTHLYWDPRWPHAKAAQAELLAIGVNDFLGSLNLSPMSESNPTGIRVVVAGDFNSVRHVQPEFFPDEQKLGFFGQQSSDDNDSSDQSGVYALLVNGVLAATHPEHPDTFGRALPPPDMDVAEENGGSNNERNQQEEDEKKKKKKKKQKPVEGTGVMSTGVLLPLRDVYATPHPGVPSPVITTKTDVWSGNIDYIFYGESGLTARAYLQLPEPTTLAPIPSARFPSDHLALGAEFEFILA
jgi:endonuclease/exonuclease/phosphatase family metal-dependent hydrolase